MIEGNGLSIRCNSTSYPSPSSYTWTFPGGSYNGQTVPISSVDRSRTGNLVCIVNNMMNPTLGGNVPGTSNGSVDLQVLCKLSSICYIYSANIVHI